MTTPVGSFTSTASSGAAAGADLVIPASAFTDEHGTPVPGAFPDSYVSYYVSVNGVQLPRLGARVAPDATSVLIAGGATLDPATLITVGPKSTKPSPRTHHVPSSGMEWLHLA